MSDKSHYPRLTKVEKEGWIAELRDPLNTQTFRRLFLDDVKNFSDRRHMCALGALYKSQAKIKDCNNFSVLYRYIITHVPRVYLLRITSMNDIEHKTLSEIADFIDREVPVSDP